MTLSSSPWAFLSVYTLTASPRLVVPNGCRATEAASQAVVQVSSTHQPDSLDLIASEIHTVRSDAPLVLSPYRGGMMTRRWFSAFAVLAASAALSLERPSQDARPALIPPPQHPPPHFERAEWQNLNGPWQFQFDAQDVGESQGWSRTGLPAARPIGVPFPWGSPLAGAPGSGPIGWYPRAHRAPGAVRRRA